MASRINKGAIILLAFNFVNHNTISSDAWLNFAWQICPFLSFEVRPLGPHSS
jgi:hypothetical protein